MALITDPDNLNQGVEVNFVTGTSPKTIELVTAGNLSTDGVTLKALYSFCKEEWKDDASLIPIEFPFVPITDEAFELKDDWDFLNDSSRYLVRTGGWTVKNTSGNITQKWAGIVGLGTIEANDQLYFDQGAPNDPTNIQLQGQVNQAVQIYRDDDGLGVGCAPDFDYSNEFTLFVREQGQTFGSANLTSIGVSALDSQAYRFPISTSSDSKITETDNTIDTTAPYTDATNQFTATDISFTNPSTITTAGAVDFSGLTAGDIIVVTSASGLNDGFYEVSTANATTITVATSDIQTETAGAAGSVTVAQSLMSISYYASPQSITISGTSYNFGVIIDAAGGTAEEVYEFVQRTLRRNIDVNPESTEVIGKTTDELLRFVGDDLKVAEAVSGIASVNPAGGGNGVYITNFQASDTNRLFFVDNTGATVQFDFVAVLSLDSNPNLTNDADAIYRVFFTTNPAGNYGTANAVIVHANDNVQSNTISFDSTADTITIGTGDFSAFAVNEYIEVENSASNDGYYKIASITTTTNPNDTITVDTTFAGIPANESAGATVDVTQAMMGDIAGASTVQLDFNYDNNVQGGRTSNTNAPITVVAIGLQTGQFVSATTTIERNVTNSVGLVAPLERNYENA